MVLFFVVSILKMSAIHVESRIVPKVPRCTMDMLNQKMKIKTEDVGKISIVP